MNTMHLFSHPSNPQTISFWLKTNKTEVSFFHAVEHFISERRPGIVSATFPAQTNYLGSKPDNMKEEDEDKNTELWLRSWSVCRTGTTSNVKGKWKIAAAPTFHQGGLLRWLTAEEQQSAARFLIHNLQIICRNSVGLVFTSAWKQTAAWSDVMQMILELTKTFKLSLRRKELKCSVS